jgi:hypothetical protein
MNFAVGTRKKARKKARFFHLKKAAYTARKKARKDSIV